MRDDAERPNIEFTQEASMTMEKTKADGQRSAYRDSLKRRNSTMRELRRMADKPMGEPQSDQRQAQAAATPTGQSTSLWAWFAASPQLSDEPPNGIDYCFRQPSGRR
jgi:hypothetical protein